MSIPSSALKSAFTHQIQAIQAIEMGGCTPEILDAMSGALKALLAGFEPSARILSRVLESGSTVALSSLFDTHDPASYAAFHRGGAISLDPIIKQGRADLLEILHAGGFDLSENAPKILQHALRHNRPEGLALVRDRIGSATPLVDGLRMDYLCRAMDIAFARELASEIRSGIAAGDRAVMSLLAPERQIWRPSSKVLAIQLAAGLDLLGRYGAPEPYYDTPAALLIRKSGSQHGRLWLQAKEPSLADVLVRPDDAAFFGMEPGILRALPPKRRNA